MVDMLLQPLPAANSRRDFCMKQRTGRRLRRTSLGLTHSTTLQLLRCLLSCKQHPRHT